MHEINALILEEAKQALAKIQELFILHSKLVINVETVICPGTPNVYSCPIFSPALHLQWQTPTPFSLTFGRWFLVLLQGLPE